MPMGHAAATVPDNGGGRSHLGSWGRWPAVAVALAELVAVLDAAAAHAISPDADAPIEAFARSIRRLTGAKYPNGQTCGGGRDVGLGVSSMGAFLDP
jgi:hypothetical protein